MTSTPSGADLAFAGVARQGELLHAGAVTPRDLVECYLGRIERLDPQLNAFVAVRAEAALAEADAALERLRAGESGPLLGIPVAVKDNVDIEGEVTGHGTAANQTPATSDAEVVRRLRAGGAPMLGKTALPELAMWGHMTESEWHGPTRNPWNLERATGGSSGGSPGPRGWPPRPWAPTAVPPSASPRRCAGCSGSSRPVVASPRCPTPSTGTG
jgi:amidase